MMGSEDNHEAQVSTVHEAHTSTVHEARRSTVKFNNEAFKEIVTDDEDVKNVEELCLKSDFGVISVFCFFMSIFTFVADLSMHCWMAYIFYTKKENTFFVLTVTFIIVPSLISTGFSIRWYILDEDDELSPSQPSCPKWSLRIITMLLQLTQIHRYCNALCYGFRSVAAKRRKDTLQEDYLYRKMLDEDCDATLLRLFYCILNSAPQAVLQLSILISYEAENKRTGYEEYQLLSVAVSSFSVAWSLVIYHRTVRYVKGNNERMSWKGIVLQFISHMTWAVSRIVALSAVTAFYPKYLMVAYGVHSFVMGTWLLCRRSVEHNYCDECILSCMLGIAYIFIFISSRSGPQRHFYSVYYTICLLENIGCLIVWYHTAHSVLNAYLCYGLMVAQVLTFSISLSCLILYYKFYHPSKTTYYVSQVSQGKRSSFSGKSRTHNYP